ncbi:hypothetical protein GWI68_07335 [Proteus sp. G2669]|uniref:hypothetical protein n=1 Tax=Proteus sp. G2669 TaxID=2698881 RepID=UPI0014131806|nr:hypothetical protein [Proteus sp. G2669]NBM54607.1 hypothetical protein [Proteus sp. G2669]
MKWACIISFIRRVFKIKTCIFINRAPDCIFRSIKGSLLNTGQTRRVFEIKGCSKYIIKEQISNSKNSSRHNEVENYFYSFALNANNTEMVNSLAKVLAISKTGKYLIMQKLETPVPVTEIFGYYPVEVSDRKLSNFGYACNEKRVKMLDYSTLVDEMNAQPLDELTISGTVKLLDLNQLRNNERDSRDLLEKLNNLLM